MVRLALKNKDAEELEVGGKKYSWAEAMKVIEEASDEVEKEAIEIFNRVRT